MNRNLFMGTTQISSQRTAGEIAGLLARAGATAVMTEYGPQRQVVAVAFRLRASEDEEVPFRLPVRVDAVYALLRRERKRRINEPELRAQAERIAWRQILRWVEAQVALIETGMVATAEVFLPYVQVGINATLYEAIASRGFKSLPAPKE